MRDEDLVARLGGDEFVVLLDADRPDAGAAPVAEALAHRLVEVLGQPFDLGGRTARLGASVGIAHVAARSGSAEDAGDALLRDADIAMYAAKAAGKGQVRVFDPSLQEAVVERVGLVGDLGAALGSDELFLRWLPVVDVATGRAVGLEALPRWQHPQRGELAGSAFVAAAEQAGLALPLAGHVLGQACAALRGWQALPGAAPGLRVVVGVSPRQVLADGLVDAVRQALQDAGVPPQALVLQVAGAALTDVAPLVPVLRRLHALGVPLAVDDFGGPGCSLSQLRRLPLDAITLDASLVADGDATDLLEAVVALAARLGVRAVASGVRTPEQWALLGRVGCPMGKPPADAALRAEQVPAALARRP